MVPSAGLLVVGNDLPPMVMFNPDLVSGIFPDIIRAMTRLSGVEVKFAFMPWARALATSKSVPGVCAIPASITPEREAGYAWIGPIYHSRWKFFALANSSIVVNSLDEARRYKVSVLSGSSQEEFLARAGGFNLESAGSQEANIRKLAAGRIELWAGPAYVPDQVRRSTDIKTKPVYTFHEGDVGIACNLDTDKSLLERMRAAFATLRKTAEYDAITRAYEPTE